VPTDEVDITEEEEGVHVKLYYDLAPELDLRVRIDL
jgi:hypothetical protein